MTVPFRTGRFWTGPRIFAAVTVTAVALIFIGVNVHLVAVSFATHPDCVLHPVREGTASWSAADPSC